jgi:hypothetical protein
MLSVECRMFDVFGCGFCRGALYRGFPNPQPSKLHRAADLEVGDASPASHVETIGPEPAFDREWAILSARDFGYALKSDPESEVFDSLLRITMCDC